jgi:hypothetical protein
MIRWPKPGEEVAFLDEGAVTRGLCNGEPISSAGDIVDYIPVYVHEGDRCLLVHAENIVEWPEKGENA